MSRKTRASWLRPIFTSVANSSFRSPGGKLPDITTIAFGLSSSAVSKARRSDSLSAGVTRAPGSRISVTLPFSSKISRFIRVSAAVGTPSARMERARRPCRSDVAVGTAAETEPERIGAEGAQNHGDVRGFSARRGNRFGRAIYSTRLQRVETKPFVDGGIQAHADERRLRAGAAASHFAWAPDFAPDAERIACHGVAALRRALTFSMFCVPTVRSHSSSAAGPFST